MSRRLADALNTPSEDEHSGVYLDNAAHHPVCFPVIIGAMIPAYSETGNPHALNGAGSLRAMEIEEAEHWLRSLLYVRERGTIIWTSSSTEAAATFFNAMKYQPHPVIGYAGREHACVSHWIHMSPEHHHSSGHPDTPVLTTSAANSVDGLCHPSRITKPEGQDVILHTDITQAIGKIDLKKVYDPEQVDAISMGFHKCGGPCGIGALWVSDRVLPFIQANPLIPGSQQGGLRGGTLPTALIKGVRDLCQLIKSDGSGQWLGAWKGVAEMRDDLLQKLMEIGFQAPLFDMDLTLPGHIYGYFPGVNGDQLVDELLGQVDIASGSACSGLRAEPCPLHKAKGFDDVWPVRISLGLKNSPADVHIAFSRIISALGRLKVQLAVQPAAPSES